MGAEFTTEQKGQIAIVKVQHEAIRKEALVLVPTTPARFDLGLLWQAQFYRCQVKYADCRSKTSSAALYLDLRRRKRVYTWDEIDVLLVYIPQLDKICWFPPEVFHEKVALQIRLAPAKNNQWKRCLMAADSIW